MINKLLWISFTPISIGLVILGNPLSAITGAIAVAAFVNDEPN